jgi:hypothetical protein
MHVEAVRALRRAGDGERDQLAVLAGDGAVFPADDRVQPDEALEFLRRQRLQLRQQFEIVGIVIVSHSTVPPV